MPIRRPLFFAALLLGTSFLFLRRGEAEDRGPSSRPAPASLPSPSRSTPPSVPTSKPSFADLPSTKVAFSVERGTWLDLDLSPDGKRIVFSLLGDLYLLGVSGGKALRLTRGTDYDTEPRWSPDGSQIAFVSDRDGGNNVWLIKPDGSGLRQVTFNGRISTTSPVFSPDGQYLLMRRRITDRSSIGTTELWLHHLYGGKGIQITKGSEIGDANDPSFSPDGRTIYFASRGRFVYDRDPHRGIYQIQRLDLQTKEKLTLTTHASRPLPSPDGKTLAFIRRIGPKTALVLHDFASGQEDVLTDALDRDLQEGFATAGTYPRFAWDPGSKALFYFAKGHFWKKERSKQPPQAIHFSADVEQTVTTALRWPQALPDATFRSKLFRWPRLSPQGDRLVWSAVGRLWSAPWPQSSPITPLTEASHLALSPAFSHDGKSLAYAVWTDQDRGAIVLRSLTPQGSFGPASRITTHPGHVSNPVFSPDGRYLAFVQASGSEARGRSLASQPWLKLVLYDRQTNVLRDVINLPNLGSLSRITSPLFSRDSQRLFFTHAVAEKDRRSMILSSVKLDGTDKKHYLKIYGGEEVAVSPDECWLLFRHLDQIYLSPLPPPQATPIDLQISDEKTDGTSLPTLRLSGDGGSWPSFGPSDQLLWSLGPSLFTLPLQSAKAALLAKAADPKAKPSLQPKETSLHLHLPVARPSGLLAIEDIRIVPVQGPIISKGTILLQGERILALGPSSSLVVPPQAKRLSFPGYTATPGFIDTHAHLHYNALDIHPQYPWEYYANLAFGVTSSHDPSASSELVFTQAERVQAGYTEGPRIFSTGFILFGAEIQQKAVINDLEDGRRHLRRLKALGAFSVKSYMQPQRKQRRLILQAAHQEKMLVFPEGGGDLLMNLSMILDGHTGIEHALPITPLQPDVVRLFATSQTGYTPTLLVAYGGLSGENFFYQFFPPLYDKRLQVFIPPRHLSSISRRRPASVYDQDWHFKAVAAEALKIARAGGRVLVGAHGQLQGLGYQWEMQALGYGGFSPTEVLRAATLHGAEYLGLDAHLGSLQPGKRADILLFKQDPSKSLAHLDSLAVVIKQGFVYRADTLERIYPSKRPRPRFLHERRSSLE